MASISQLPRGLLAALGLRNLGKNPGELSDLLAPTFETLELYLLNGVETVIGDDAAPAIGTRNFSADTLASVVPQNELWYVWHYRLTSTAGAGTSITLQPTIRLQDAQQTMTNPQLVTGAAGLTQLVPSGFNGRWALPGSLFQYGVTAITGAPGLIRGVAQITRLRV
jgi:hypothetical protein